MPVKPPTYRPPHVETRQEQRRAYDERRGSARERGYDSKWDRARAQFLAEPQHAICSECQRAGLINPGCYRLDGSIDPNPRRHSLRVDHIVPHRGDMTLFWRRSNWQALCADHHDIVKQREERAGRVTRL